MPQLKPFQKRLLAGILFMGALVIALALTFMADNSEDLVIVQIFIVGFMCGIIYWLYANKMEARKVKKQRDKEKGR